MKASCPGLSMANLAFPEWFKWFFLLKVVGWKLIAFEIHEQHVKIADGTLEILFLFINLFALNFCLKIMNATLKKMVELVWEFRYALSYNKSEITLEMGSICSKVVSDLL